MDGWAAGYHVDQNIKISIWVAQEYNLEICSVRCKLSRKL